MKLRLNYFKSLFVLLLFVTNSVSAQQLTLSNNLLYDATLTPNLRLGVRLSPHWSLGLTAGYRPWPTDDQATRKYKHLLISPDLRYWTDSVNVHHFFGFNAIYAHYNVGAITFPLGFWKSVRDERQQGDFVGIGAFYGYSWPLGRHWNFEAFIGAAVGYNKYDRYECAHCGSKLGTEKKVAVIPQAGLNIVFNIPGRPRQMEEPVLQLQSVVEAPVTAAIVVKPFAPALTAIPDFKGRAGQLQQENPVVQHISNYRPYDRTRILRKEKDALFVHFDLGKSQLNANYRDNQRVMERIVDITRQIMSDSASSVKKVQIIGLASIEGNPAGNERLAQNRALALQKYIQQEVTVPDSLFETVGGGEAWADFRDHLNDLASGPVLDGSAVESSLRQALAIIDNEPDAVARERKLRRLNGGKTWKYIQQHILKDQRNSGYIRIYFDYVPDKAAATINEASELLTTDCIDCHREALRLLQTVRNDERAQNALGVALWLTGQKDEALECFRRAAANGNSDAQENLRRLEIIIK